MVILTFYMMSEDNKIKKYQIVLSCSTRCMENNINIMTILLKNASNVLIMDAFIDRDTVEVYRRAISTNLPTGYNFISFFCKCITCRLDYIFNTIKVFYYFFYIFTYFDIMSI